MRVVVTGGAGFIGANLCRALVEYGLIDQIVALDDLSTGSAANLDGVDVELVVGSILDRDLLRAVTDGADSVVHLAARPSVPRSLLDPMATHEVNATGTLEVLEACRAAGNVHLIVASSSSVYGANPALPKHEGLVTAPMSPYGASKLATEQYALAHSRSFGLPVLAFRFFNVFGPLQAAGHAYAAVIPAFVSAALAGSPLTVHGDGSQTRDFTFVDSVTRVIIEAIINRIALDGPVNLAFGTRTDLRTVIAEIERVLGHPVEVRHVDPRPGDVPHSQASSELLRSLVGPIAPVPLSTGLRRTIDWMRSTAMEG